MRMLKVKIIKELKYYFEKELKNILKIKKWVEKLMKIMS